MSDAVARYLAGQTVPPATEGAAPTPLLQPNVFARSIFMVCEIEEISRKVSSLVDELKASRAANDLRGMSDALRKLDQMLSQGAFLARCLSTVVDREK